jgi:hypothetical protein
MLFDFGPGISLPIKPESLAKAKQFVQEVLRAQFVSQSRQYTVFRFPNGQMVGLCEDSSAPAEADYYHSIWLELLTDDFPEAVALLKSQGITEVRGGDEHAFFFHLPGGPVFKLSPRP